MYGARTVWREFNREGFRLARCRSERLMCSAGLVGALRGGAAQHDPPRPRRWGAACRPGGPAIHRVPTQRLVSGRYHRYPTWSGMVYAAFLLGIFSRRMVGWRLDPSMRTNLPLDALEMTIRGSQRQPAR